MISASHNPPEYNGIKIFDHKGQIITKKFEDKIQKLIEESNQIISDPKKEISFVEIDLSSFGSSIIF